jgi:hypothetical protein
MKMDQKGSKLTHDEEESQPTIVVQTNSEAE